MPLVNFSNLDFDQIKTSIKDYLRANSNFTDYDFEGSNLSTIIDTLAYNTYITSYNANMVTNEVFIDSATLRENVVSLARNIGYMPRSRRAARMVISFQVSNLSNIASLTLNKGLVAVTAQRFGNADFVFSIPQDITVPVNQSGVAEFNDIMIYEGTHLIQTYNVSSRDPNQRFILPNTGVDTTTISVSVKESSSSTVTSKFSLYDSLIGIGSEERIYFIQEIDGERYELLFGDGVIGKKLEEPNQVNIGYIVSNGQFGNNISFLSFAGSLTANNGDAVTTGISQISVDGPSTGGSTIESVESIKKYGPQIYASQNRAVTAADYEALVPTLYPEAESVSAYGGEELTPPQYGKVFISIKPVNGVFLSNCLKDNLNTALAKYKVAGIQVNLIDLGYLYIEPTSQVYYNSNLTPSSDIIKTKALDSIEKYADSTELNKFGARFKYSKYQYIVDKSDPAITSNITTLVIRRDLEPKINFFAEYELCYGNRFRIKNHCRSISENAKNGFNIKSSAFRVSGIADTVYLGDYPNTNQITGELFLFKLKSPSNPIIVKRNVGIVDYMKGEIKLNPIKIISSQLSRGNTPIIEISAVPYSNDIIGLQDLYLQLDMKYTVVNTIIDQIDSGNDISGTNYIVSSSYSGNELVRGVPILGTQTGGSSVVTTTQQVETATPQAPASSVSQNNLNTGSSVIASSSSSSSSSSSGSYSGY